MGRPRKLDRSQATRSAHDPETPEEPTEEDLQEEEADATNDFSRYREDPELFRVQTTSQAVKESRASVFGVVPIDAIKALDKRRFCIVADATLDDVVDTFDHLFANYPLCDNCDEPATLIADLAPDDNLTSPMEMKCDGCNFSGNALNVRATPTAEAVHRCKAMIAKLQDRR